ncbi:MAG: divergent PAP2 family protein [Clostridium sp.]|uniref:divergent PAP2 family protein n=1 Tax=Clostridium TaxID=1485 RepID=UPI0021538276|nr:divergent PAP2 family protein [Clostridium sp. LY3-2]MCR6515784.1 divergent PAP2 family protein [Clostridium sp. LY3-2]
MNFNKLIELSLFALILAQLLKVPFGFFINKELRLSIIFETGGMPSSHSAYISSLAVGIGRTEGFKSPIFALAFVIASIVMYDAMGVRRAAGQHAKFLNILMSSQNKIDLSNVKLKEILGHTPFEVLGGLILGLLVGFIFPL